MQRQFSYARAAYVLGFAASVGFTSGSLSATTLQRLDLPEMIEKSTSIVRARVVSSSGITRHGDVFTIYKLEVLEQWKQTGHNAPPHNASTEVAVPGGVAGGIRQIVSGAPTLRAGDEYVLFLWQGKSGLTQLMGLTQGLFRVVSVAGPERAYEDAEAVQAAATEQMLDAAGRPVRPDAMSFKLSALRARVAGTSPANNTPEGAQGGAPRRGTN